MAFYYYEINFFQLILILFDASRLSFFNRKHTFDYSQAAAETLIKLTTYFICQF